MYLVVYLTRYGDLLFNRFSFYLTTMKMLYIGITTYIIYLVRYKKPYKLVNTIFNKKGYEKHIDNFNHYLFLYPTALVFTIVFHSYSTRHPFFELCWSYSCWLEVVAIIPQIVVIYKKKEVKKLLLFFQVEVITGNYVALIAGYKGLYLLKWILHIFTHDGSYKFVIKFITAIL